VHFIIGFYYFNISFYYKVRMIHLIKEVENFIPVLSCFQEFSNISVFSKQKKTLRQNF